MAVAVGRSNIELAVASLSEGAKQRADGIELLLLQYPRDLGTTEVAEKRKLILGIANDLSLKVIDTYDVLRNAKQNELWYHDYNDHTPLGNELVCSYLFEQGFPKQKSTFWRHSRSTAQVKASALGR